MNPLIVLHLFNRAICIEFNKRTEDEKKYLFKRNLVAASRVQL